MSKGLEMVHFTRVIPLWLIVPLGCVHGLDLGNHPPAPRAESATVPPKTAPLTPVHVEWAKLMRVPDSSGIPAELLWRRPFGGFGLLATFEGSASVGDGERSISVETPFLPVGVGPSEAAFFSSFGTDGVPEWARLVVDARHPSSGGAAGDAVFGLGDGGAVVAGRFWASSDVFFGRGEPGETAFGPRSASSELPQEVFLARYDPSGALRWARRSHASFPASVGAVAASTDGTIYVAGSYGGSMTLAPGESREQNLPSAPPLGFGAFLASFDGEGSLRWARSVQSTDANTPGGPVAEGLALLSDGSLVISGTATSEAIFGKGEPLETRLAVSPPAKVGFVARYTQEGALTWVAPISATGDVSVQRAVATPEGIVVTGTFSGTARWGSGVERTAIGHSDLFLAKYDLSGKNMWARIIGGAEDDASPKMAAFQDGSLLLACAVGEPSLWVDPGGQRPLTLAASDTRAPKTHRYDMAFVAFDPHGEPTWAERVAVTSGAPSQSQQEDSLAADIVPSDLMAMGDGAVVVAGRLVGTARMGNPSSKFEVLDAKGRAAFVARFVP